MSALSPALPDRAEPRLRWVHLHGSSRGLAIARAARRHDGPVVVVVPDPQTAMRAREELQFFGGPALPALHFPDWETLPYDVFSPHHDIVSERLSTLNRLPELGSGTMVVPVSTLMVRLAAREYLQAHTFWLRVGDRLDLDGARANLDAAGYRAVGQVLEHGEFAVRGSLLDLFPMGADEAYRIDLLDEEIDSIRSFDAETQRSIRKLDELRLIPAREFPVTEQAIARFRQAWRAEFEGDPTGCPIYRDVSQGLVPSGIEYYLPLFFEATGTLFDHLPRNALLVVWEESREAAERYWEDACARYESRRYDRERPILAPARLFLTTDEVFRAMEAHRRVVIGRFDDSEEPQRRAFATRAPTSVPVDGRAPDPLALVKRFLAQVDGRTLFTAETAGRRELLRETLAAGGLRPAAFESWEDFLQGAAPQGLAIAPLEEGLVLDDPRIAVVSEAQLFGERARQRRRRRGRDAESIIRDLTELSIGAAVVHEDHGVGRYRGLETLTVGGMANEYLTLEYADGDKLYVPVSSLHLVTRYAGADTEHAPLHKLGSPQWQRARRRAAERAHDVAAELLEIYSRRAARDGHRFALDNDEYRAFSQDFPFEETPDQQEAIERVLANMTSGEPMDRLVCGDVGFGKTEVAMRAAFVAVQDGWQVAVLVPTTLLAQQHHQTFGDRFAEWPVNVELLSRFRSKAEQDRVLADLAAGKVDILIGTHKVLGRDVAFKRLGLVVVDEEHRFGVRQKERLKELRTEVDVLTLTATPIPRTLSMALSGLRDLTLMATPPEHRLSIKTFVRQWDDALVREACLREIRRGGQVFFVHNRVETIAATARKLQGLLPEADVRMAHGKMREHDLEQVMLDFYHRRFNVLVCTTIIETGIDVPNANTIVINRADRFGLAQLHQLRGRVGRSHHRAYAYLVVPPRGAMTNDAVKRLEAIESLEDLGIGFTLATHDLEIRGAGELLGEEQSGQIHEVGYSLYTELLERAVRALRSGKSPQLDRPLDHGAEIDIQCPTLIPADYLPDVHTRLIMYKRIASASSHERLRDLEAEMIDRFGPLPRAAKMLFVVTGLKLKATPLGIRKADLGEHGGRIAFHPDPNIDASSVIRLIQEQPRAYKLDGQHKLRLSLELPDPESRIALLNDLFGKLEVRIAA